MEPVILRTRRLELSRPVEDDIDAITAAAQDPEVPLWTTLPSPYERSHAEQFVADVAEWWAANLEAVWAIRVDGRFAGMIGLHHLTPWGDAEIGYWMAAPERGKGYLTEAAVAVIDYGLAPDGLDLARIEWRAIVGNVASARAARTLGFHFEGTMRQALSDPRKRSDGWVAGLLPGDDRVPQPWPILED